MVVDGKSKVITITPALSLIAYSVGDQMGIAMKLKDILDASSDTIAIQSIVTLDKAGQSKAYDILFFDQEPVLTSVDNAALSISDVEMEKFVGRVKLSSSDFSAGAANSDNTVSNIGLLIAGRGTHDLWAVLQSQGTPTFATAGDLMIKVGAFQD